MFSSRLKNMSATFLLILLVVIGSFDNPYFVLAQDDAGDIKGDISDVEKKLKAAEKKKSELESELANINASLSVTDRAIKETKLKIQQTENTIVEKEAELTLLENKIDDEHDVLKGLMRDIYYESEWPLPRIVLSEHSLSDIFDEPDHLLTIQERIEKVLDSLSDTKSDTESQKQDLADAKQDHESLLKEKTVQKYALVVDREETTEDVEDAVKIVKRLQKELAELQSDLSLLTGKSYNAKDIKGAVEDANNEVNVSRGVLYGFLKMETNLGANTGQCTYKEVKDAAMSRYYNKNKKKYQSSIALLNKRYNLFLGLIDDLGYSGNKKVSCTPSGYVGQGGAMGVSQFMSDVWINYTPEIRSKTGHKHPDPWGLSDGVMAMALKVKKAGAPAEGCSEVAIRKASISYLGAFNQGYYNGIVYWCKNYKELF